MKGLILIALLALCVVGYLVMYEKPKPVPAPVEQAEPPADIKVDVPPPPEPPKRTIEEIRADVAKKTAENIRPVVVAPPVDPNAARNARRAEFQSKIDAKRSELNALEPLVSAKRVECGQISNRIESLRVTASATRKQWRWVVGGKVDESRMTWNDISTLPPKSAWNGKLPRFREVPVSPSASGEVGAMEGKKSLLRAELSALLTRKERLENEISNLGLQMNMAQ